MTIRRKIQKFGFPVGMINSTLHGRFDREEHPYAAAELYNMIYKRDGTITRRNGLEYLHNTANINVRIIPFERSEDKSFVIIFKNGRLEIISLDGTTITENWYTDNTPWAHAEIHKVDYVQSGDRMWLVHPDNPPHTLTYIADDNWELAPMDIKWDERLSFLQRPFGVLSHTEEIPGLVFRGDLTIENNGNQFLFQGPADLKNFGSGEFATAADNTRDPVNIIGSLTATGEFAFDYNIPTDPPNASPTVPDTGTNRLRYLNHNEALRRDINWINFVSTGAEIGFIFPDTSDLTTRITENQTTLNEDAAIPDDDMDTQRLTMEEKNDIEDTISRLRNEREGILNKFHNDLAALFEIRSLYLIHPTNNTVLAEYKFSSLKRASLPSRLNTPRNPQITFVSNKNINDIIIPSNQAAIDAALNAMPPQTPPDPTYESEYRFRIIISAQDLDFTPQYPKLVEFHEDRLVFAVTDRKPRTLWFSNTGIYDNFSRHLIIDPVTEAETEADDSAITIVIAGRHLNEIQWVHSDDYSLLIGTEGAVWNIRGSGDPRFPSNITHSTFILKVVFDNIGVSSVRPIQIERRIIIVEKDGRKVHEIYFSGEINTYQIRQLNYNALDIFTNSIIDIAYQRSDQRFLIWCLLQRNSLGHIGFATCTYIPEEGITAWSSQDIADIASNRITIGRSIVVIPDTDVRSDNLFIAYTSGGSSSGNEPVSIGLIRGSNTTTFQDAVWNSNEDPQTTTLNYTSRLKTLPLVPPELWGDRVHIQEAWIRLLDSHPAFLVNGTPQELREDVIGDATSLPTYTGWYRLNLFTRVNINEREPSLTISTDRDGPLEITNIKAIVVQEEG